MCSVDFLDDARGGFGPGEGVGDHSSSCGPGVDGLGEVGDGTEAVLGEDFASEDREPCFDEVEPRGGGKGEVQVPAFQFGCAIHDLTDSDLWTERLLSTM